MNTSHFARTRQQSSYDCSQSPRGTVRQCWCWLLYNEGESRTSSEGSLPLMTLPWPPAISTSGTSRTRGLHGDDLVLQPSEHVSPVNLSNPSSNAVTLPALQCPPAMVNEELCESIFCSCNNKCSSWCWAGWIPVCKTNKVLQRQDNTEPGKNPRGHFLKCISHCRPTPATAPEKSLFYLLFITHFL